MEARDDGASKESKRGTTARPKMEARDDGMTKKRATTA